MVHQSNVIEFVTIATTANATDFGDVNSRTMHPLNGQFNSTRGLFGWRIYISQQLTNIIEFITIASAGNATDFGDAKLK